MLVDRLATLGLGEHRNLYACIFDQGSPEFTELFGTLQVSTLLYPGVSTTGSLSQARGSKPQT